MPCRLGRPSTMEPCASCGCEWIAHYGGECWCGCRQWTRRGRKWPKWIQRQEERALRHAVAVRRRENFRLVED
jgi:hypothetical protein